MFKDKLTFRRYRETLLNVINNITTQNGFRNARANCTAYIRADFMAIFQVFVLQNVFAVRLNKDEVGGNWKQFKGKVKEQWGKLTDDDMTVIEGKRDQLVGKVQERYGYAKDQAEKEVNDWEKRNDYRW